MPKVSAATIVNRTVLEANNVLIVPSSMMMIVSTRLVCSGTPGFSSKPSEMSVLQVSLSAGNSIMAFGHPTRKMTSVIKV